MVARRRVAVCAVIRPARNRGTVVGFQIGAFAARTGDYHYRRVVIVRESAFKRVVVTCNRSFARYSRDLSRTGTAVASFTRPRIVLVEFFKRGIYVETRVCKAVVKVVIFDSAETAAVRA